MKLVNKALTVAAFSMSALVALSANAAQPWSGEQPQFDDFTYQSAAAVNPAEVQAQARQAIAQHAFNDQMSSNVPQASNGQAAGLSRAEVQAQADEALRNNLIQVGE